MFHFGVHFNCWIVNSNYPLDKVFHSEQLGPDGKQCKKCNLMLDRGGGRGSGQWWGSWMVEKGRMKDRTLNL